MGDNLPAVRLGAGETASAISTGYWTVPSNHTCAVLNDHSVECWGSNTEGALGLGDSSFHDCNGLRPVDLGTGKTAVALAARGRETCALLNDGSLKCWGENLYGQLGLGDTTNRGDEPNQMGDDLPAVDLGTGKTPTALGVGADFACALLSDHSVKCWGHNNGQLGLGDTTNRGDGPGQMGDALPTVKLFSSRW
jgi:hypothetical protein